MKKYVARNTSTSGRGIVKIGTATLALVGAAVLGIATDAFAQPAAPTVTGPVESLSVQKKHVAWTTPSAAIGWDDIFFAPSQTNYGSLSATHTYTFPGKPASEHQALCAQAHLHIILDVKKNGAWTRFYNHAGVPKFENGKCTVNSGANVDISQNLPYRIEAHAWTSVGTEPVTLVANYNIGPNNLTNPQEW